jgi:hypothetical protein
VISLTNATNSSFFEQKSVSEFTSTSAPAFLSSLIKQATIPSAATLVDAFEALFPKRTLSISSARVASPSASLRRLFTIHHRRISFSS